VSFHRRHVRICARVSVLQLLANHIALALNNISQYDTLRSLHETGQLLTQQLDSGDTLQVTVDKS